MDWDSSCLLINIWMETASDIHMSHVRGRGERVVSLGVDRQSKTHTQTEEHRQRDTEEDRDTGRQKKTDIETDRCTEGRERQTNTRRDTIQRYKRQTQRQTQIELERGTEEDRDIV